jgi:UrcA family protein
MNAMPRHMKLRTVVACSLFATSLSSLAAVSTTVGPEDDSPSRIVKFADLDLTHSQGAAVLYARIKSAARAVCLPADNWMMKLRSIADQCRDQAIARAVTDVNAPALTTYHMEHSKPTFAKR